MCKGHLKLICLKLNSRPYPSIPCSLLHLSKSQFLLFPNFLGKNLNVIFDSLFHMVTYGRSTRPVDSAYKSYPEPAVLQPPPLLTPFVFQLNYCRSRFNSPTASILHSLHINTSQDIIQWEPLKTQGRSYLSPWFKAFTMVSLLTLYKQSPFKDFQSSYVRDPCHLSKAHLSAFPIIVFYPFRPPCHS